MRPREFYTSESYWSSSPGLGYRAGQVVGYAIIAAIVMAPVGLIIAGIVVAWHFIAKYW